MSGLNMSGSKEYVREYVEWSHALPEEAHIDDYIIGTYYFEPIGVTVRHAAEEIAIECSTGTWTKVKYETPQLREEYGAKIVSILDSGEKGAFARIAYAAKNYDPYYGSVENILTGIAGNVFDGITLNSIRLIDIELPQSFVKEFPGPNHGPEGFRNAAGISGSTRPMVGSIIKPNLGLDPKTLAQLCYELALGGIDLIKDDEDLLNPSYCKIEDRTTAAMDALDRAKSETGKKALYAVNTTGRPDKILELAQKAIDAGTNCLMLDVAWTMFSSIRALSEDPTTSKYPLHIHRAGHGAYTRSDQFGITEAVMSKLCRLCGADQLHVGTVAGKFIEHIAEKKKCVDVMMGKWFNFKQTMPNASAAIHPGNVETNVAVLGKNVSLTAGGGIHGHPDGVTAGVKAMIQACEAIDKGIPTPEYAKDHKELARALDYWSYIDPAQYLKDKL